MPDATTFADLPDRAQLLSMSGFDFMCAMRDGTLPRPPIARVLNYTLAEVLDGEVTFSGMPDFDHTNPMGTVHGGWYGTILDSAMACAVMTKLPKGSVYTTLEYKVNLIRAVPLGTLVDCIGETDHVGRSTGVATGRLVGVETGTLYATGSTTCLVMPMT